MAAAAALAARAWPTARQAPVWLIVAPVLSLLRFPVDFDSRFGFDYSWQPLTLAGLPVGLVGASFFLSLALVHAARPWLTPTLPLFLLAAHLAFGYYGSHSHDGELPAPWLWASVAVLLAAPVAVSATTPSWRVPTFYTLAAAAIVVTAPFFARPNDLGLFGALLFSGPILLVISSGVWAGYAWATWHQRRHHKVIVAH